MRLLIFLLAVTAAAQLPSDKALNIGTNKAIVVLANLTDATDTITTRAAAESYLGTVRSFVSEISYGKATLETTLVGWVTIPLTAAQASAIPEYGSPAPLADAVGSMLTSQGYNLADYRHLVIYSPWAFNGLKGRTRLNYDVGSVKMNVVFVWANTSLGNTIQSSGLLHELGHSYGAMHDGATVCPSAGPALTLGGGVNCWRNEYTGRYSVMSDRWASAHMSPRNKDLIGWLPPERILDLTAGDPQEITLSPYETSDDGIKAVRWRRALCCMNGGDLFYVSYQSATGINSTWAHFPNAVGVYLYNSDVDNGQPRVIDLTPSDTGIPDVNGYSLGAGGVFVDPATQFRLEVLSMDASGASIRVTPGQTDTRGPSVRFLGPVPSENPCRFTQPYPVAIASGTVSLSAAAEDDLGVARVAYRFPNQSIGGSATAPHIYEWDTTHRPNGKILVIPDAFDFVGASQFGCPITIDVQNPPDSTPPQISITAPTSGQDFASGSWVWLYFTISDTTALGGYEIWKDGDTSPVQKASDMCAPDRNRCTFVIGPNAGYTFIGLTNGAHRVQIRATDIWGNRTESPWVEFTVGSAQPPPPPPPPPPSGDTEPPTVTMLTPVKIVGDGWRLTANASDNIGVTRVEFLLNGYLVGTDQVEPFEAIGNAGGRGWKTAYAVAFDAAGNRTQSNSVRFR